MASIYRRREYRPVPAGARVVAYRGKPYAQWTNAKTDKTQRAPLNEAGDRIVQAAEFYTVQYFDENGRRTWKPKSRCAARGLSIRHRRNSLGRAAGPSRSMLPISTPSSWQGRTRPSMWT
jgi:hypothetical protein